MTEQPEAGPYEILNVGRDATLEEIKKVHRRLVVEFHPDNQLTGDADRFQAIQQAYEVLSDPVRRARYDETGVTEAAVASAGLEMTARIIEMLVSQMLDDINLNPATVDISSKVKASLMEHQRSCRAKINEAQRWLDRGHVLRDKFEYLGEGTDMMRGVFDGKIKKKQAELRQSKSDLDVAIKAIDLFKGYRYKMDPLLAEGQHTRSRSTAQAFGTGIRTMSQEDLQELHSRSGRGF